MKLKTAATFTGIFTLSLSLPSIGAESFTGHLPADTEGYLSITKGKEFANGLKKSKIWQVIEKNAEENGASLDELEKNPEAALVLAALSEDCFVSFGKGTGEQTSRLMKLNEMFSFIQMKSTVQSFAALLEGDASGFGQGDDLMKELLENPAEILELLDGAQMPPILVGAKISDEKTRGKVLHFLTDNLQDLIKEAKVGEKEVAEKVEFKNNGLNFKGVKITGEKIHEALGEQTLSEMTEMFGEETGSKAIELLKKGNLILAGAQKDNYVLFYIGTKPEDLQLAATPVESLASSPKMDFLKAYVGKEIHSTYFFSETLLNDLYKNVSSIGASAKGIKAGLADSDKFGDTRDLEMLLEKTADTEKELYSAIKMSDFGGLAFIEEGLKFESFGGSNYPQVDLKAPSTLGGLVHDESNLLTLSWSGHPDYSQKTIDYMSLIGETLYVSLSKYANLDIPAAEQFKQMYGLFDAKFKGDALAVWGALSQDWAGGVTGERALVFDLGGALPALPGVPDPILKNGKAPRFLYIRPVSDRKKIQTSWTKINGSIENILKSVGEMQGQEIPMQKPMSSEKGDLTTWFFPIPMTDPDFMPCVSVSDSLFIFGTSQKLAQKSAAQLAIPSVDNKPGVHLNFNVKTLQTCGMDYLGLVKENGEEILGSAEAAEEFNENLPKVSDALEALGELEKISSHLRVEDGQVRSTTHFKVN